MDRKIKIVVIILFLAVNSYSQSIRSNLDEKYLKYRHSSNSENKTKLIDYLMKQYCLLDKIEESYLIILKPPSKEIEYYRLELFGYEFFENMENFEINNKEKPVDVSEEKLNQYAHIYGGIKDNFGIFRRLLNCKDEEQNKLFEEFKNNNQSFIALLIQLIDDF